LGEYFPAIWANQSPSGHFSANFVEFGAFFVGGCGAASKIVHINFPINTSQSIVIQYINFIIIP
jgi:hypothetical protein